MVQHGPTWSHWETSLTEPRIPTMQLRMAMQDREDLGHLVLLHGGGYSIASQLIWFALYTWNHGCMYILASALHVPVNQPNQIQVYLVLGVSELEV
ncbi:hypothetical protein BDR06DRAFT_416678 [Suillus hirtellus]|nr:hypothetical protein BDR06DRAFT_416678 [Suillus hirtellus]